jgi:hypothetical protein
MGEAVRLTIGSRREGGGGETVLADKFILTDSKYGLLIVVWNKSRVSIRQNYK